MEMVKKENFSCEDCEMAIIAGTVESNPAAEEHLANCSACRSFAEFQKSVLQAEPVLPENIPDFAQICSGYRRQKKIRFNCLKFIVLPTAAAAALLLTAGGVFFHWQSNSYQQMADTEYAFFADEAAFAALLDESSVTLAWDQTTPGEVAAGNLVQDIRNGSDWNIEIFNPYNEDLL